MTDISRAVRETLQDRIDAGSISGGIVLVKRDGEVVDLQAHGHADFDRVFELKTDSLMSMMSMTKPFTAACAMILVSEGKLGLDDPVSKYIPEFSRPRQVRTLKPGESYPPFPPTPDAKEPKYDYAPAEREITVRHLLTFTSGLQTIGIPNGAPNPVRGDTLASYIPKLNAAPLEFQPGTRWHYSNIMGYNVLGRVIEVASGQSFQDFARERMFEPLGMTQTQFGIDPAKRDQIAPLGSLSDAPITWPDFAAGTAGLFSRAEDYGKFTQMLLDEGRYRGKQIMDAKAVQAMRTPQIDDLPFEGIRLEYATPIHVRPSSFTYGFGVGILAKPDSKESVPVGSYGWDGMGSRRLWVIPSLNMVLIMLMPVLQTGTVAAHRAIEAVVTKWAAEREGVKTAAL